MRTGGFYTFGWHPLDGRGAPRVELCRVRHAPISQDLMSSRDDELIIANLSLTLFGGHVLVKLPSVEEPIRRSILPPCNAREDVVNGAFVCARDRRVYPDTAVAREDEIESVLAAPASNDWIGRSRSRASADKERADNQGATSAFAAPHVLSRLRFREPLCRHAL